MHTFIDSSEAKTHFSKLLERVSQGEEICITRRGKPVAKLIPAEETHDLEAAKAAALRLRSLAKQIQLDRSILTNLKSYRDVGSVKISIPSCFKEPHSL